MLDYIVKHTKAYLEEKSKTDRKLIGQFLHLYEICQIHGATIFYSHPKGY